MLPLLGGLVLTLLLLHTGGSDVQVDPEVYGYVGEDVTLPCRYSSTNRPTTVTQVQWFQKRGSSDQIIIVFHTQFGLNISNSALSGRLDFSISTPVQDASIVITQVALADQGDYICEFITFPAGSSRETTTLTVTESRGPLSKGQTAGVAMAAILAILLLVTVVFLIRARKRNNKSGPTTKDRNPPQSLAQGEDVTYSDVTFQRQPITNPDATLDYMTVKPNNQSGSAPPSPRGSDCDWPPCPDMETVYSAVKVQSCERNSGRGQRF